MTLRTAKDIGALIRERRRRQGRSQEDLAAKVGVSRKWLVEVEQGKPRAELSLVLRTLQALDIQLVPDTGKVAREKPGSGPPEPDIDAIVDRHRRQRRRS